MTKIKIEDVPGHEGEYDLDLSYFKNKELHTIKRLSGVRAGEIETSLRAGDTDVLVAMALIAIQRAGRLVEEDALWEAEVGKITVTAEEEPEAGPAEAGGDAGPPSGELGSNGSADGSHDSSGSGSSDGGDSPQESSPPSTGNQS